MYDMIVFAYFVPLFLTLVSPLRFDLPVLDSQAFLLPCVHTPTGEGAGGLSPALSHNNSRVLTAKTK